MLAPSSSTYSSVLGLEADLAAQAHMRRYSKLLVVLDSLDEVRRR